MKNRKIIILFLAIIVVAIGVYSYLVGKKEVVIPVIEPRTEVVKEDKKPVPAEKETTAPIPPKEIIAEREKSELEAKEPSVEELGSDFIGDLQRSKELYKINYNSIVVGPKPQFVVTNYPKEESIIFVASTDRVSKLRFKNNELSLINSIPLKNNRKFSNAETEKRIKANDPNAPNYSESLVAEISEQFPIQLLEIDDQHYVVSQKDQIFSLVDEDEGFYLSATSMNAIYSLPNKLKNRGDYIVSMKETVDNDLLFLTHQGVLGRLNKRLKKAQYFTINTQELWGNTLVSISENRLVAVSDRAVYSIELKSKLSNSVANRTPLHMKSSFPIELEQTEDRILFRVSDTEQEKDVLHIVTYFDELEVETIFIEKDLTLFLEDFGLMMNVANPLIQNTNLKNVSILEDRSMRTNWRTDYPVTRAAKNPKKQNIFVLRSIENLRRFEVLERETGKLLHSITLKNDGTMIPYSAKIVKVGNNIAIYGSLFQLNAVEYHLPSKE